MTKEIIHILKRKIRILWAVICLLCVALAISVKRKKGHEQTQIIQS